MNLFPNRLIIQAVIEVDGHRYATQATVEAEAWQYPEVQEHVKASLRAELVTELVSKWTPRIAIQPVY